MRHPHHKRQVGEIASLLKKASSALFITGAGISAESGLPTYRGVGGLYNDQHTEHDVPIEVALSGRMFDERPEVTWHHLSRLESAVRDVAPNRAHRALAQLQRTLTRTLVLTQNVDGLHAAAGSRDLVEIHGNIHRLRCPTCGHKDVAQSLAVFSEPPACSRCGRPTRPDVVLFGESLPSAELARLKAELAHGFDIVFIIGTTAAFPYISGPVISASRQGVPTVEINPAETEVSHFVTHRLATHAGPALDAILSAVLDTRNDG
jgi:NAD-dependent deacetylase